jgi:hypothetical protein
MMSSSASSMRGERTRWMRTEVAMRRGSDKRVPEETRRKIDAWREAQRSQLEELSRRHGKLLFDGEWLTPEQVRRHHWRLRWRSLRVIPGRMTG